MTFGILLTVVCLIAFLLLWYATKTARLKSAAHDKSITRAVRNRDTILSDEFNAKLAALQRDHETQVAAQKARILELEEYLTRPQYSTDVHEEETVVLEHNTTSSSSSWTYLGSQFSSSLLSTTSPNGNDEAQPHAAENFIPEEEHYPNLMCLGRGGQGVVYLSRDPWWGNKVAVKKVPATPNRNDEFDTLCKVSHPHIVRVLRSVESANNKFIVMEAMQGPISKLEITGPLLMLIIRQTLSALAYLHSLECRILHRDIKPDNLLFDIHPVSGELTVKLADFGLATTLWCDASSTHEGSVVCGTRDFMAPESPKSKEYSRRSDMYSFGRTIAFLATQPSPEHRRFPASTYDQELLETTGLCLRPELAMLILQCLATDKDQRPQAQELLELLDSIQKPAQR